MKTKITLIIGILIISTKCFSQVGAVTHIATEGVPPFENITWLDIPELINNANALVVATKGRDVTDNTVGRVPDPIYVGYDEDLGHFIGYVDQTIVMEANTIFHIFYALASTLDNPNRNFTHCASEDTFISGFPYTSLIDNPLINEDALWRGIYSLFLPVGDVENELPFNFRYNLFGDLKWGLETIISQDIPQDSKYNILGETGTTFLYEHHSASKNIGSEVNSADDFFYFTVLDHPFLNGNPDAVVMAQTCVPTDSSNSNFFFQHSLSYNIDTGFWELHIEFETFPGSDFTFPLNIKFSIHALANGTTLSIDEPSLTEPIKIYPNPTNHLLTIEVGETIQGVSIFNMLGQKLNTIDNQGTQTVQLDVSNYTSGNYLIQVQLQNTVETLKFIKD